jgi:ABC-type transport system involved in multi-copper enzyme maturation permease subunit
MQLGLFLRRALVTSARGGTVFHYRVAAVIVAAAVVAGCVLFWDRLAWDRTTIAGTAWFGLSTYGLVVGIQTLLAMAFAGASIARERDRKSLDSLLATRLTSAEIVLGLMVTGLVRSANCVMAALPVVVLVAIVGGVPPLLVLLTAAGLGSSVFAAAALAVAVSVYAPNRAKALSVGTGLCMAWMDFPLFFELLLPRVWPGSPRWLVRAVHWPCIRWVSSMPSRA